MRNTKTMLFLLMTLSVVTDAQRGRKPLSKVKNAEILNKLDEMHDQQMKMMEALNKSKVTLNGWTDDESDGLRGDYRKIFKMSKLRLETLHKDKIAGNITVNCCKNGKLRGVQKWCGSWKLCSDACGSRENNNSYVISEEWNINDESLCSKITGDVGMFCDPRDERCDYGMIADDRACSSAYCEGFVNNSGKRIIDEPCCCRHYHVRCAGSFNRVECAWNGYHGNCPTDD